MRKIPDQTGAIIFLRMEDGRNTQSGWTFISISAAFCPELLLTMPEYDLEFPDNISSAINSEIEIAALPYLFSHEIRLINCYNCTGLDPAKQVSG